MKLHKPTKNVFLISFVLVLLAVVSMYFKIPFVDGNKYWFVLGGYILLFLSTTLKWF